LSCKTEQNPLITKLTLFSPIISKLDTSRLKKLVKVHQTDKHQKGFNNWSHLVSMLFCQFTKSQAVQYISNGVSSAMENLNHLGMLKSLSKSKISYQNKNKIGSFLEIIIIIIIIIMSYWKV